jgi:orotate phosphoribosyltransferase
MGSELLQTMLVNRLGGRKGHFRLESGHHSDLWLDLDSLFVRPRFLQRFAQELTKQLATHNLEAVCGPWVGGAFLAQTIASELDVEFYYAERIAQPQKAAGYAVHYRIPDALRNRVRSKAIAVVDDVISAGSAVRGTIADLRACGARPVTLGALLVLGDAASTFAAEEAIPLESVSRLPNNLWQSAECPLCARHVPLEDFVGPCAQPAEAYQLHGAAHGR